MRTNRGIRAGVGARIDAARRALAPLGAAASFSWLVLAIYCPIGVAIQAPANASIYGGSVALWVLASAIGMLSLIALLSAARARALRRGDPSPSSVLLSYALAATAQSVTFGLLTVLFGADDSPHLGFRLTGLFLQVPLLAVVGYAVARHDAHRRIITELGHTREQLLAIGQSVDAELDRVEAELTYAVQESLEPAMASFDAALTDVAAGGEKLVAVSALDVLVEQRVRPLAHELVAEPDEPAELTNSEGRSPARVPLPERFRLGDAIKPGFAAIVLVVGALPTAARALDPGGALIYLATLSLSTWVILTLAKRVLASTQVRTTLGLPVAVLIYAVAGSAAFWCIGVVGVTRPVGIAGAVAVFLALLGLAIGADLLVQTRRARSESELAAQTLSLEQAVALIRRRERLVRRRLAFVVHGALQGALHAAALRLAESDVVSEQLGEEIRRDLGVALAQIEDRPKGGGSLRTSATISELLSVWDSHRHFSARLGESVEETLSSDADVDEAVAEVIREAVNNAFRHGAANTVEVEVTVTASSLPERASGIGISVRDDGSSNLGASEPGLGSVLFDDLCRSWELDHDGRGTTFQALIALNA